MYYYQEKFNIYTKKLKTIEQELNDMLAITLTKEDTHIVIIAEEDKQQYYKDYILDFFAAKELHENSNANLIKLTNNSSIVIYPDTDFIRIPRDYILNTTNRPINEKILSTYLRETSTFTF